MVSSHYSTSRDTCATSPRLILHPALIGSDEKAPVRHIFYEIHVCTLSELLRDIADSTAFPHHIEMFQITNTLHIMRRASIKKPSIQATTHLAGGDAPHSQFHDPQPPFLIPHHNLGIVRSVISFEMQFVTQSKQMSKSSDTPATVPAHRTQSSVAVIVFHLEIIAIQCRLKRHQSIGPHTKTPVAYLCHLGFRGTEAPVAIVYHDEIISRTVKLIKWNLHLKLYTLNHQ